MEDIDFSAAIDPHPQEPGPLIPEIVGAEEILPSIPEFSTQDVAGRVLQYEQEVVMMEQRSKAITIVKDDATNAQVAEWGQQAKKLYKKLEELRKAFVAPHVKFNQTVNAFFKRFTDRLLGIDMSMGRLESAYARLKENERRIQQAEADRAAKELQDKLDAEAREAATKGLAYEPVQVTPQVIPEAPKVTRTAEGSSSQRKKWTYTITDAAKVPREYCEPSQKLLNEAIKAGVREIAGCLIEEDFTTVRRV